MGASAHFAEPDKEEIQIANTLIPIMKEKEVVIFGFDTLVGDDNRRVLSEINSLNMGGLYEAEYYSGKPIIENASNAIWEYIAENIMK